MQSTDKNLQAFTQSTEKFMQRTDQAIQLNSRDIHELKSSVAKIEEQINHLVIELNRIEEEELQSQLMIERHCMSDEDDFENSYHEHSQVTTTLDEDEVEDNEEGQVEHNSKLSTMRKVNPQQILICPVTWK